MKDKILFSHYGKCGGTFVMRNLAPILTRAGYEVCSGHNGPLDREELFAASISDGPIFVHNQHVHMAFEEYLFFEETDFFTFSFLRHPADIVCSLYYWGKRVEAEKGANPFGPHIDLNTMSLNDYFEHILYAEGDSKLWRLPPWVDRLDYVAEFSFDSVIEFVESELELSSDSISDAKVNFSDNMGFLHYYDRGDLEQELVEEFFNDEGVKEYGKYIDLWTV
jgi:hypothetical protein